jgi:hypothetical protein
MTDISNIPMKCAILRRTASLVTAITLASPLLFTRPCWADPYAAALPWDGALIAMQNMLIGTVAPAVSGLPSVPPRFSTRLAVATHRPGGYSGPRSVAPSRSWSSSFWITSFPDSIRRRLKLG